MRLSRLLAAFASAALVCGAARADEPKPPAPPSTEDQLVSDAATAKFAPVTTPGIPAGAESALVGVDPNTKGGTAWVRFSAGMTVPMHWHTHAEYSVVLSGKATLTMDGKKYALGAGSYAVIPAKIHHALTCEQAGACVLLTRRAGPADYNFVK